MIRIKFQDSAFDNDADWVWDHQGDRLTQRHIHVGSTVLAETSMTVRSSVQDALALLCGPWTWWDHGRIMDFHMNRDLSIEQTLVPIWWIWTRVGMLILPPIGLSGSPGFRLPILLSRHFEGTSSVDVYPKDGSEGTIVIRGRFHGVESHVPLLTKERAAQMHLHAEAGTFSLPFPRGTGFIGLSRRLEGAGPRRALPFMKRMKTSDHSCVDFASSNH